MVELAVGPDTVLELVSTVSEVSIEGKELVYDNESVVLVSSVDVAEDSVYEETEVNSLLATELVVGSDTKFELVSVFSDVTIKGKELVDDDIAEVLVSGMDVSVGEESLDEDTDVDSLSMAKLAVITVDGKELVDDDEPGVLVSGLDFAADSVNEDSELNSLSATELVFGSDSELELVSPLSDVTIDGKELVDDKEAEVLASGMDISIGEETMDDKREVDSLSVVDLADGPDTILELAFSISEVATEGKELVEDDETVLPVSGADVAEDSVYEETEVNSLSATELVVSFNMELELISPFSDVNFDGNKLEDDNEAGFLVSCMDIAVDEESLDEEKEVDSFSTVEVAVIPDIVLELISPISEVTIEDNAEPGVLVTGVDVAEDSVYKETEVNSFSATELVVDFDTELELVSIFSDAIIDGKELEDDDDAGVPVTVIDVNVVEESMDEVTEVDALSMAEPAVSPDTLLKLVSPVTIEGKELVDDEEPGVLPSGMEDSVYEETEVNTLSATEFVVISDTELELVSTFSDVTIEGKELADNGEVKVLPFVMYVAVGKVSMYEEKEFDSLSMAERAVGPDTALELVSPASAVTIEGKVLEKDDENSVYEETEVNSLSTTERIVVSDTELELVSPFLAVTIEGKEVVDNDEVGVLACGIDVAVGEESVDEYTEVDSLSLAELAVGPKVTIEGKELVDHDEAGVLVSETEVNSHSAKELVVGSNTESELVSPFSDAKAKK
ncbi:hypothetical protein XELAEV_18004611mg [Xenopus laevis]|uniref:Uncharacterized protein n=1 Tax=Xenopus laevis TaxID=8355 RepID=A0A974GZI8_XENLA|nr:hypothetical protein XELAEV_18004611mg [Xenopus laevis]